MYHRLRFCILRVSIYLTIAVSLSAQGVEYSPGTYRLTPTTDLQLQPTPVQVPARFLGEVPEGLVLNLPPGFSVKLYAIGLRRPRQMAVGPDGVLYVANMKRYDLNENDSEIVALPDRDRDGVADTAYVAAGGLHMANSLAFHGDAMYVAEADGIVRLRDEDGDGLFEQRVVLVKDIPARGWHTTRTIAIDAEAEKIYVGVGAPCDLCRSERPFDRATLNPLPATPEWGSVLQFDIDGGGRRIYATGMRNVVGLALHPVTKQLWGTHNGHDREGPDLPPEWIDIILEGGFMGFPFVYGYRVPVDFSIDLYRDVGILPLTRQDSLLIESQRRPVALIPAHLAPLGMHFYTQDRFPEQYRNAAFVAVHGGQTGGNLAVVPGFKVTALLSEPDGSEARVADFLTGFGTDDKGSHVWGKPAGVMSDDEGFLYVTSDHRLNAVFRVEATPLSASWSLDLPDTTAIGSHLALVVTVRITRSDPDGQPPVVVADLSAVRGGAAVPLEATAAGVYELETTLDVHGPTGLRTIQVHLEQNADSQVHRVLFSQAMFVAPGADVRILDDELADGWRVTSEEGTEPPRFVSDGPVFSGSSSLALRVEPPSFFRNWSVRLQPQEPVVTEGYTGLRFAFHPNDVEAPTVPVLAVSIDSLTVDLVRGPLGPLVDFRRQEWQIVELPLSAFDVPYQDAASRHDAVSVMETLVFEGNVSGTLHLDDVRLVTPQSKPPAQTAVVEVAGSTDRPSTISLSQNAPNPFNSSTLIEFSLASDSDVLLAVYNLAGQRVAVLTQGTRPAGAYRLFWDGVDDTGLEMASGVYLYRLRTGQQVLTRRLLLLR